ncbi:hypothetical protein [Culturomica massiliensis]|jgi:hypothetical protein|uniref:hypothetical protein n=1 Tax=Culturomica massiliensis TaxID=1841857 RepID=UPI0009F54E91|nr:MULTISPECIES: hypothetical protein [Odoribacteraceae]RHV97659.1 hypothetical protein DXA95_03315 [Odoribacter sp. OF09-27XD]
MDIIELSGEDQRLYHIVGHLVMNSEVLTYNLNYPFRTSPEYRWFVAMEKDTTLGFIPVKVTSRKALINNYYIADDDKTVFSTLLQTVIRTFDCNFEVESVSQMRHIRFFEQNGFSVVHYWKRYVKMKVSKDEEECI